MSDAPLLSLVKTMAEERLPLYVDSRRVVPGGVFVSVSGSRVDGAAHIDDAVRRGAAVIVCTPDQAHQLEGVRVVTTDNPRLAAARLAAARWNTAALPFALVGVTGTNGKTTTTYLLEHLFTSRGLPAGVIGTIATRWPGHDEPSSMTTPDGPDLHAMLACMAQTGVRYAAMEVSSHALDQDRAACIPFSGAVFTNLTQDHLDYHKTFEAYYAAKARLFLGLPKADKAMAVGIDGVWGRRLVSDILSQYGTTQNLVTFGLAPAAPAAGGSRHLEGRLLSSTTRGLHLAMRLLDENGLVDHWEISSPLVGAFNAENLLAVQAVAVSLGFTPADFGCFTDFCGVPGRLERIRNDKELDVFVDYAHTPDALTNVLAALRGAGFARIVCVFGCGGNRDRTKRPLMGQAVARDADVAVLTSDNPRHEDPQAIMADVMPGLADAKHVIADPDRREAIRKALALLHPGDALLVAGKGHETTQQIGDVKHPFSDQQTLRELLSCL